MFPAHRISRSIRLLMLLVCLGLCVTVGGLWLRAQLRHDVLLRAQQKAQQRQSALLQAQQRQEVLNKLLFAVIRNQNGTDLPALASAGFASGTTPASGVNAFQFSYGTEWRNDPGITALVPKLAGSGNRSPLDTARMVQTLLAHGAQVNARGNIKGQSLSSSFPLIVAAETGQVEVVRVLLAHGADIEAQNEAGDSALLAAASRNTLWNTAGEISAQQKKVMQKQQSEVARVLLKAGADVEITDTEGETALLQAAAQDNSELALQLLDYGAKVNVRCSHESPLARAAENNNVTLVKALLGKGAKIELPNVESPLLRTTSVDVLKVLLAHGANLHTRSRYWKHSDETVLMRAAWNADVNVIRFLLQQGADVNETNDEGITALELAAFYAEMNNVRFLLDHGAKPDLPGRPVLLKGVENGDFAVARLLMRRGARVNAADEYGTTALMRTAEWGDEPFALELLRHGADVNARDKEGQTALHRAAQDNNDSMVELLLDWGARINARDKDGHTPLWEALAQKEADTKAVTAALKEAGAKE